MKLQILSDLHLEFSRTRSTFRFQKAPGVDALILAGDIHAHLGIFALREELAEFKDVPILYVPGNHEYYGQDLRRAQSERLEIEQRIGDQFPNLHVLDDKQVNLRDGARTIKFIGSTLWTETNGDWFTHNILRRAMSDFAGAIKNGNDYLHPNDTDQLHRQARAFIGMALGERPELDSVVITHHLPHPVCVHPKYERDALNPAFVTDLDAVFDLNRNIKLWVHGHTHEKVDATVYGTRIVCNPYGYPHERKRQFDPLFTVDV